MPCLGMGGDLGPEVFLLGEELPNTLFMEAHFCVIPYCQGMPRP